MIDNYLEELYVKKLAGSRADWLGLFVIIVLGVTMITTAYLALTWFIWDLAFMKIDYVTAIFLVFLGILTVAEIAILRGTYKELRLLWRAKLRNG